MTRHVTASRLLHLTAAVIVAGCAAPTPPIPYLPQYLNLHRRSGSFQLPETAAFDRGACLITGRHAVALVAGPHALLLCDLTGPNNRCELMLTHQDQLILYERIGQRPLASAAARKILAPTGIRANASDKSVLATFNLYLQPSERLDRHPRSQRSPNRLRLAGNLRLPRLSPDDPLATTIGRLTTLVTDPPQSLTQHLADSLPAFKQIPLPQLPELRPTQIK
jgi:hypothetical protein